MANLYIMLFRADIGNVNNSMGHQIVGFLLLPLRQFLFQEAILMATISNKSSFGTIYTDMCLEQNTFQGFPITHLGRVNMKAIKYSYSIAIYCYCRMPETFAKTMIKM